MSMIFRKARNFQAVPLLTIAHQIWITQQCYSIFISYQNAPILLAFLSKLFRPVFARISFLCGVGAVSWNIPLEDCSTAKLEASVFPHPSALPCKPFPAHLKQTMGPVKEGCGLAQGARCIHTPQPQRVALKKIAFSSSSFTSCDVYKQDFSV